MIFWIPIPAGGKFKWGTGFLGDTRQANDNLFVHFLHGEKTRTMKICDNYCYSVINSIHRLRLQGINCNQPTVWIFSNIGFNSEVWLGWGIRSFLLEHTLWISNEKKVINLACRILECGLLSKLTLACMRSWGFTSSYFL